MSRKRSKKGSPKKKRNTISQDRTGRRSRSRKIPMVVGLAIIVVTVSYFIHNKYTRSALRVAHTQAASSGETQKDIKLLRGGEVRPTLEPFLFRGKAAKAYSIAKGNRELLDSIYCYCHCERTLGHKSLLSCFVNTHALECDICQNQAIFAFSRHEDGLSILQVRKAVDEKFWRPFS
jgi:hypothetical protein